MAQYDFIVVGGGPAGSVIASGLARSKSLPSVLLIEAGGTNKDSSLLPERYLPALNPGMTWGYQSTPQTELNGKVISFVRGKGIGGSSAVNYLAWTKGPSADYDEWARLVGDDFFKSDQSLERLKRLESHAGPNSADRDYIELTPGAHGKDGPVKVGYPSELSDQQKALLDRITANTQRKRNLDVNSGNSVGVGVIALSAADGYRSSSASVLENAPENLEILTDAHVTKVVFKGKRAVAVVANGKSYSAKNEIIISCGALESPKLLLLSGVGPKSELEKHGIVQIHDLAGVGRNLSDHVAVMQIVEVKRPADNIRPLSLEAMAAARTEYLEKGTGPYSETKELTLIAYPHISETGLLNSSEISLVPVETLQYLQHPTVPIRELVISPPENWPMAGPDKVSIVVFTAPFGIQSTGTLTLASSNPADPPVCDLGFFSNPFDLRNMIEGMGEARQLVESVIPKDEFVGWVMRPASDSDEDARVFLNDNCSSVFHISSTVKMGKPTDELACVDSSFRVFGLQGLRVADLSSVPFVFNCHTQTVAYIVGASCVDKLIAEYGLDK